MDWIDTLILSRGTAQDRARFERPEKPRRLPEDRAFAAGAGADRNPYARESERRRPPANLPPAEYRLEYRDAHGQISRREISRLAFHEDFGVLYLSAHCHWRLEERNFRVDRIIALHSLKTGEREDAEKLARRALGLDLPETIREEFGSVLALLALILAAGANKETSFARPQASLIARHIFSESASFDETAPERLWSAITRLRIRSAGISTARNRILDMTPIARRRILALAEDLIEALPQKRRSKAEEMRERILTAAADEKDQI